MDKDFDNIENINSGNVVINYGIIKGNEKIVFIKVGKDGSIYGYNNKYLTLAREINYKYGNTVICASNNEKSTLINEIDMIKNYCLDKFDNYYIYYIGVSNGASLGMRYGYNYEVVKKMLLINGPLMINFDKIINGLLKYKGEKIYLIYGSLDPSIKYVKLLKQIESDKINVITISNEEHNFNFNNEIFIQILADFLN